jgi:hypothetical protein
MWHVWGRGDVPAEFFMGKPEGKSPRVIPRGKYAVHVIMAVKMVQEGMYCINLEKIWTSEGASVNTVTKFYTL